MTPRSASGSTMSRAAAKGVAPRSRAASMKIVRDGAHAAVDRQHGEGQQEVGKRHDHRALGIDKNAQRLVDEAGPQQQAVDDAVAAQNALPGVDLHEIAAEKRDQRHEQQHVAIAPGAEADGIGEGIGEQP